MRTYTEIGLLQNNLEKWRLSLINRCISATIKKYKKIINLLQNNTLKHYGKLKYSIPIENSLHRATVFLFWL